MRPRRLKLGTHIDSGQMYHVYWNHTAAAYSSLYFFSSGTVRSRRLKFGTHIDSGQMYHFSFSPIFNIEIFCHTFLGNCKA